MKHKLWLVLRFILIALVVGYAFFLIAVAVDKATALGIPQSGVPGGCFEDGNRNITFLLFPLKEPMQCIWHTEDALYNLPYHLWVGTIIAAIATYLLDKKNRSQAN